MEEVSLEARRLALEERKFDADSKLRELDLQLKRRESSWTGRLFSPLTATLIAGVLTLLGTAIGALIQGSNTLQLEAEKEQHELILKMVAVGDVEQARKNIKFLAETGLITRPELAKKLLEAKETPVLPRPAGQAAPIPAPKITPDEFARRVSPQAVNMLIRFETGGRDAYETRSRQPSAVGAGINIGFGYDLGLVTEETFRRDWSSYLPAEQVDRLASVIGIRGEQAKAAVAKFSDISIRWEDALAVFSNDLLRWPVILDSKLPNTRDLSPDCYGALLSLAYNRGVSFNSQGDRYTEMRNIYQALESRQFDAIPAQLRAMKRLWPSAPGLANRREQEAVICELSLKPHDAQASGPPQ